jgi:plastocyanin
MKKNKILAIIMIIIGVGILISHFMFHDMLGLNKFHPKKNTEGVGVIQNVEKIAPNTVEIKKYTFSPEKMIVKKGTMVTWINYDIAPHTVTIDDENKNGPKSKYFGKGEKFTYTFKEAGVFPYHCEPHPYMKAVVEVVE